MADEVDLDLVREKLANWFATKLPQASEISLSSLKRAGAGSSNETFFLQLDWREGADKFSKNLVVRWPPKGFLVFPEYSYDMRQQYRLLEYLADTPVPTPPVFWMEEDVSVLGAPFYIMERVDGWVPSDFPPYHTAGPLFEASESDRASIWLDAVDTLAKIHTVDWQAAGLDFLGVPKGKGYIEKQIAYYDEVFEKNNEPMPPVLARAREWFLDNSFTPRYLTLCWGDARLGNMVFRDHRVAAVLDWEMACIGDPESDLGWFAHIDWASSIGRPTEPLARLKGLPSMEETIAHYERTTDRKVENFTYYEAFATWRMAILYTRIEQDERYLQRSGNAKGFINWTHFEKLQRLIGV